MTGTEKARSAAATVERATMGAVIKQTPASENYSTTDSPHTQAIFDLLPQGEGNAIPSKFLAEIVGVQSVRELQNRIAAEREGGKLILSTCRNGGGYFRPSDGAAGQAEISAFIDTLRARALNTLRILKAAKTALDDGIAGQLDFDDLEV